MAFFRNERIEPTITGARDTSVVDAMLPQYRNAFSELTAGPNFGYTGVSNDVYDQAANQLRQQVAQQVTNRGMSIGRGAYANLTAKGLSDLAKKRAEEDFANRTKWLGTVLPSTTGTVIPPSPGVVTTPQIQPSGFSQISSPFLQGVGYKYGGDLFGMGAQGATKAYEALRDWFTPAAEAASGVGDYLSASDALAGPGEQVGGWSDVGAAWGGGGASDYDWTDAGELGSQATEESPGWFSSISDWVSSLFD